jgi:hypothetical protein
MNPTAFRLERQHLNRRVSREETVEVARRLCGVHAQVLSSAVTAEQMERLIEAGGRGAGAALPDAGGADRGGQPSRRPGAREATPLGLGRVPEAGRAARRPLLRSELRPERHLHPARHLARGRWRTPPRRTEARTELLRRFLSAYGPATADDFERWIGAIRRVKEPWEALAAEVEEIAPKTFVLVRDREPLEKARSTRGVRLRPAFDPYVLQPYSARPVDPGARERVYRTAGWVSATVLDRGRVVGVWEHRRQGRKVAVEVRPFAPLDEPVRAAVAREAAAARAPSRRRAEADGALACSIDPSLRRVPGTSSAF